MDAYCGVGSLTLFLARRAKRVYGVEVVAAAIANARENAALNRIENVEFIVGETERVLPRLQKKGIQFDVAVVDPPRSECEEGVLRSFAENNVGRIVYVSCNPATLARDLKILDGLGIGWRRFSRWICSRRRIMWSAWRRLRKRKYNAILV